MVEKHINWQYVEGLQAYSNLLTMLGNILKELEKDKKVSNPRTSFGEEWGGYYFDLPDSGKECFIGQYFNDSMRLTMEVYDKPKKDYHFDFSEHFFFSRDALGQRQELKKFIIEKITVA